MSQLHQDLQAIREHLNLTREDIYDRTRISIENIESIESGELFQSDRNKTYVRSFARSYAKALGISDNDMIHALDLTDLGSYQAYLAGIYLPEVAKKKAAEVLKNEEKEKKETVTKDSKSEDKAPEKKKADDAPVVPPVIQKKEKQKEPDETVIKPKKNEAAEEAKEEKLRQIRAGTSSKLATERKKVNWSETNKKINAGKNNNTALIAAIVIFFILLILGYGVYHFIQSSDNTDTASDNIVTNELALNNDVFEHEIALPEDTTRSDTLDAPLPPDPAISTDTVLPDTLYIEVFAAFGNLEPFRVRSDTFENRRPYWVEVGKAMRISFIDEIHLYNHRDRMLILYDGRVINQFADENPAEQRVTITREQFLDDAGLAGFTTNLPQGVRPPTEVIDRPIIMN